MAASRARETSLLAAFYSFLAEAFRQPTREPLQALCREQKAAFWAQVAEFSPSPNLGRHLVQLQGEAAAALAEPEALGQLVREYDRLFRGPYHVEAPPYESLYVGGADCVMGEAASTMLELYAEAGLALAPDWHDLPDHVAAELAFMAYMGQREAGQMLRGHEQRAEGWRQQQHSFLKEHLGRWLPLLRQRVEAAHGCAFYIALASTAELFTLAHLEELRARLWAGSHV